MIIETLQKNAHYFYGVVDTEGTNSFHSFVRSCSRQYFLDIYLKKTEPEKEIPERISFMADFLSGGYASVIKEWMISGNRLQRDDLVECLYEMTPEVFR